MRKFLKSIVLGCLVGTMVMSTNVWAQTVDNSAQESRLVVRKYIERTYNYLTLEDVPESRIYSYYDHDYATTLKGTLTLVDTVYMGSYVRAVYAGWCSGSI